MQGHGSKADKISEVFRGSADGSFTDIPFKNGASSKKTAAVKLNEIITIQGPNYCVIESWQALRPGLNLLTKDCNKITRQTWSDLTGDCT
ncbi:MAG: hypothetical protein C5B52_10580 [Bacteroidetes bacterium]|nr:MAG: hypothetical protein C5B52_10580 [Bacteroidota bacterium]